MSDLSEKALKNAEKNEAKRQAKMAKFLAKQAKLEVFVMDWTELWRFILNRLRLRLRCLQRKRL